jgi:hypothetical protein
MNNFVDPPSILALVKLSGRITRYHHRREFSRLCSCNPRREATASK